jgi:hypothetical protein
MTAFRFKAAALFTLSLAFGAAFVHAGPADSAWVKLFNKNDTNLRNDWDIHILGSALNVDTRNTFRWAVVGADTVLDVNYANYTNWNNNPWGHIGYKHRPWNYYIVRVEHQFYGSQATGASTNNAWANQNNGIMHHSQSVASMGVNQDYPICLEAQLLGPANTGADNNSTLNLCTPGSGFYTTASGTSGKQTGHCYSSNGTHNRALALAPNWTWATVVALSDSIIRYYYKGDSLVYTFYRPFQFAGAVSGNTVPIVDNTPIKGGYIVMQGESAPTRFRRIEVLNLEGCMTVTDANYKSYLVKHDSTACAGTSGIKGTSPQDARYAAPMTMLGNAVKVGGAGAVTLELFDMKGAFIARHSAQAPFQWSPAVKQSGMHVLRAITPKGTYSEKVALF